MSEVSLIKMFFWISLANELNKQNVPPLVDSGLLTGPSSYKHILAF